MPPPPVVRVSFGLDPSEPETLDFDKPFRIGRTEECDVRIRNEYVSRVHAEVIFENGQWWIQDLKSGNGLFVGDRRVGRASLEQSLTIGLGIAGPRLSFQVDKPRGKKAPESPPPIRAGRKPDPPAQPVAATGAAGSETDFIDRYFGSVPEGAALGDHTIAIRRAYARVNSRQRRNYGWVIGALVVLILVSGGYALYLHRESAKNTARAQKVFYDMKEMDVEIAGVERVVENSNTPESDDAVRKLEKRRKQAELDYDQFLDRLHVYDSKLPPKEQLIMRVARIFGESEIDMPKGFTAEVENYIAKWKGSDRLANGIAIAKDKGYNSFIYDEFKKHDLPPQFFYLALQESNFDPYAVGTPTRSGIAKGMWQFIPDTAAKYGLKTGPLVDLARQDTNDERDHYELATKAAAQYIKDLYNTDARASGLLVMACYNWGEDSVLPLVQSLGDEPKDRNFWKLWTTYHHKIPDQTYDYVFYIFSAAVIGENPRLFGFDFDNPLESTKQ